MKKFLKSILSLAMIFGTVLPFTETSNALEMVETDNLTFDENNTAESYLDLVPDIRLDYGDSLINKEDLQTGIDIQNKKNGMRTGGELWTLTSTSTHKEFSALQGKYKEKLGVGEGTNKSASFSLSLSYLTKYGIELGASASWTFEYTRSGPSGSETVGSKYATHRYFVGIASGQVMKYTYKITDKYSGTFLRNETVYMVTNKKNTTYGINANYNASTDVAMIRSASTKSTKSLDEDTLISYWNSTSAYNYVEF